MFAEKWSKREHLFCLPNRSVLNVIQETQETQAKDLQTLKDSIEEMRQDQIKDQQSIRELQKIAEDNAWGVSDLKTSADLIRSDFTAFKALQLSHNNTMIEVRGAFVMSADTVLILGTLCLFSYIVTFHVIFNNLYVTLLKAEELSQ